MTTIDNETIVVPLRLIQFGSSPLWDYAYDKPTMNAGRRFSNVLVRQAKKGGKEWRKHMEKLEAAPVLICQDVIPLIRLANDTTPMFTPRVYTHLFILSVVETRNTNREFTGPRFSDLSILVDELLDVAQGLQQKQDTEELKPFDILSVDSFEVQKPADFIVPRIDTSGVMEEIDDEVADARLARFIKKRDELLVEEQEICDGDDDEEEGSNENDGFEGEQDQPSKESGPATQAKPSLVGSTHEQGVDKRVLTIASVLSHLSLRNSNTDAVSSAADPRQSSPKVDSLSFLSDDDLEDRYRPARVGQSSSFSRGSPALRPSPRPSPQPPKLSPSFPGGTPAASSPPSPKQSSSIVHRSPAPEPSLPPSTPAPSAPRSTTPTTEPPPPSPTPSVPCASSAGKSLPPPPPETPSSNKRNERSAGKAPGPQDLANSATALVAEAKLPNSSMKFYNHGPSIVGCCRQVLQSNADSTTTGEVTAETLEDLHFTQDVLVFLPKILESLESKPCARPGQRPNMQPAISEKPSNVPAELQLCLDFLHANLHLFTELKNAELLLCKSATAVARAWRQIKLRLNAKDPEYVYFITTDPDIVVLKKHKLNLSRRPGSTRNNW
ncbi:hypothetical protein IWX90DRAFT_496728 [Phyllosticta citrichinensis]|uniref:Uncharacterized protein n=1 Tax=Phyllosticta citrichinensis TaxID=1130410 RepID=A0ABR1Y218_9PEZI